MSSQLQLMEETISYIEEWRKEQQAEWDGRSETPLVNLSLTYSSLFWPQYWYLCRQPSTTKLCIFRHGMGAIRVFIVQYFLIRAFSITDEDMEFLVKLGNEFAKVTLRLLLAL